MRLTPTDHPGRLGVLAEMRLVQQLQALPQTLLRERAEVVEPHPVVVLESGRELGELLRLGATAQHGAHDGGHALAPAVVAHGAPAAVPVDLHHPGAAVQSSRQPDVSLLCTRTRGSANISVIVACKTG